MRAYQPLADELNERFLAAQQNNGGKVLPESHDAYQMRLACLELERMGKTLDALRAWETSRRVDHSAHIGLDGEPCGQTAPTWMTREARDVAVLLNGVKWPEVGQ